VQLAVQAAICANSSISQQQREGAVSLLAGIDEVAPCLSSTFWRHILHRPQHMTFWPWLWLISGLDMPAASLCSGPVADALMKEAVDDVERALNQLQKVIDSFQRVQSLAALPTISLSPCALSGREPKDFVKDTLSKEVAPSSCAQAQMSPEDAVNAALSKIVADICMEEVTEACHPSEHDATDSHEVTGRSTALEALSDAAREVSEQMLSSLRLLCALAGWKEKEEFDAKSTSVLLHAVAALRKVFSGPHEPLDDNKHTGNDQLAKEGATRCTNGSQAQSEMLFLESCEPVLHASNDMLITSQDFTATHPENWPHEVLKRCHFCLLGTLHRVAMTHSVTCANISSYLLQDIGKYIDLCRPGPQSALCWDMLACHAKSSPESTGVLLSHVHRYLGTICNLSNQF
jgi:hypothetical protein